MIKFSSEDDAYLNKYSTGGKCCFTNLVYYIDCTYYLKHFIGNKMTSKEAENDLETLLSMEIKLRLLDAEGVGVDIPQDPPPVPADPPNYEFCYDFK